MDCPSCAVGARGRAEAGPLGPGLSGRRRWRAPSAALEPASRGPELACGAQGARGRSASPRRALRSVTLLDFLSGFFLLKKKRKKSGFHRVGLWVLLCRRGEGRPDGTRPGGAQAASPRRKAHCAGVGLGGSGPGAASPSLFIQRRTDGSLCRPREGRGLNGNPWGPSKPVALHPPTDGILGRRAVPSSWSPQTWLLELGRRVGEEARCSNRTPKWTGSGVDR